MLHFKIRIQWILVLVCIVAFFAVAPYCQAEVIEQGTEEFCQLSGFVYNDINNDGSRGVEEWFFPEIEITLTGTTGDGDPISMMTTTGTTGTYLFEDIPAGTYAVKETQPEFLHTAIANPVGSAGGTASNPNEFVAIQLESGTSATDYNFGEWGLRAAYMSKRDFIVVEVPEPTTLAMLCMLFGGIAFYAFRRRK